MEPIESYRLLGPICIVIVWSAFLYLLKKWPGDKSMTLSRHAAAYKQAYLFLAVVRTLSAPLFLLFGFGWLVPALELPAIAYVLLGLAFVGDMVSAWAPEALGWKGVAHRIGAYAMAATFLPLALIIATSPHLSRVARALVWVCVAGMVWFWVQFITRKTTKESYLYYQLLYFGLCDTALLIATFGIIG